MQDNSNAGVDVPPLSPDILSQEPKPPGSPKSVKTIVLISLAVGLLAGSITGVATGAASAWSYLQYAEDRAAEKPIEPLSTPTEPVVQAAAKAVNSVVNIDVSGSAEGSAENLPEGHPLTPRRGTGSGVAFRSGSEGGTLILTNAHVIGEADRIVVTDIERKRHEGELIGADPETDIAVIWIPADLSPIEIAGPEALDVGQLVVAIGSPFGLTHSVSSGVISAIGRSIIEPVSGSPSTYPLVDVIQTDAAINPGNSGGALVDRRGRLIGINTAIFTESGANDGIGFAIPVSNAIRIADQLIETGTVQHPFLGIVGQSVDEDLAAAEDLPAKEGALIVEVTEGSSAEKAGLRPDDLVVSLNDDPVLSMDDLILLVRRHSVGDEVTLGLYRNGRMIEVPMEVGIKPADL
ncbi:MAG: trypsin-like peptidase domain-containing protein [Actinobacteria bacterium]|nr:trypsin-like peptidase domain-containing protein [Actinomycetota bacterium]